MGARRRHRYHAGHGPSPAARGRLPGDAARLADHVPQPDAEDGAVCAGDRVGRSCSKMITPAWSLRRLYALGDSEIDELAAVLIDCVEGGASVSFMHPLSRER